MSGITSIIKDRNNNSSNFNSNYNTNYNSNINSSIPNNNVNQNSQAQHKSGYSALNKNSNSYLNMNIIRLGNYKNEKVLSQAMLRKNLIKQNRNIEVNSKPRLIKRQNKAINNYIESSTTKKRFNKYLDADADNVEENNKSKYKTNINFHNTLRKKNSNNYTYKKYKYEITNPFLNNKSKNSSNSKRYGSNSSSQKINSFNYNSFNNKNNNYYSNNSNSKLASNKNSVSNSPNRLLTHRKNKINSSFDIAAYDSNINKYNDNSKAPNNIITKDMKSNLALIKRSQNSNTLKRYEIDSSSLVNKDKKIVINNKKPLPMKSINDMKKQQQISRSLLCEENKDNINYSNEYNSNNRSISMFKNQITYYIKQLKSISAKNTIQQEKQILLKNNNDLTELNLTIIDHLCYLQDKLIQQHKTFKEEKEGIYEELDKISTNYQHIVDNYNKSNLSNEELNKLIIENKNSRNLTLLYKDNIAFLISGLLDIFDKTFYQIKTLHKNNTKFIYEIKDDALFYLKKCQGIVDSITFKDIFKSYSQFISNIEVYEKENYRVHKRNNSHKSDKKRNNKAKTNNNSINSNSCTINSKYNNYNDEENNIKKMIKNNAKQRKYYSSNINYNTYIEDTCCKDVSLFNDYDCFKSKKKTDDYVCGDKFLKKIFSTNKNEILFDPKDNYNSAPYLINKKDINNSDQLLFNKSKLNTGTLQQVNENLDELEIHNRNIVNNEKNQKINNIPNEFNIAILNEYQIEQDNKGFYNLYVADNSNNIRNNTSEVLKSNCNTPNNNKNNNNILNKTNSTPFKSNTMYKNMSKGYLKSTYSSNNKVIYKNYTNNKEDRILCTNNDNINKKNNKSPFLLTHYKLAKSRSNSFNQNNSIGSLSNYSNSNSLSKLPKFTFSNNNIDTILQDKSIKVNKSNIFNSTSKKFYNTKTNFNKIDKNKKSIESNNGFYYRSHQNFHKNNDIIQYQISNKLKGYRNLNDFINIKKVKNNILNSKINNKSIKSHNMTFNINTNDPNSVLSNIKISTINDQDDNEEEFNENIFDENKKENMQETNREYENENEIKSQDIKEFQIKECDENSINKDINKKIADIEDQAIIKDLLNKNEKDSIDRLDYKEVYNNNEVCEALDAKKDEKSMYDREVNFIAQDEKDKGYKDKIQEDKIKNEEY